MRRAAVAAFVVALGVATAVVVPVEAATTVAPSAPLTYHHIGPGRIVDTRTGSSGYSVPKARLGAHKSLTVSPFDSSGVEAWSLNITAVSPTADGFLSVGPTASTGTTAVSFRAGDVVTAGVTTETQPGSEAFVIYNGSNGSVDVVVDVTGIFSSQTGGADGFSFSTGPYRVADTRTGLGVPRRKVPAHGVLFVPLPYATAHALWLTVVDPAASGWMSVSSGVSRGTTAVSFAKGRTTTGTATSTVADTSTVTLYNGSSAAVDVIVDVESSVGGGFVSTFIAQQPVRIADSRTGLGGSTLPIPPRSSRVVQVTGTAGVPAGAYGAALSITAIGPTADGYLKVASANATNAVTLNRGRTVTGFAYTGLSTTGKVSIYNGSAGTVDVAVDLTGWFPRPAP